VQGKVLAGRFRLIEMLGQGGMGSVWRAQHLELGTDVAVKLMDPSLATRGEGLARFRREAQAAASLKSPNVVQVFDYGVDGDIPYIAMEMLQGESLAKRIERFRRLTLPATATILSQVARAVGKAHDAGIVHRDLKPENIFLVLDEEAEIAKVLDFGIAKRTGADNFLTGAVQTQTGVMLGTPYYMSPEQAGGKKDVDHLTDIWSFGVIACECLTGKRMFDADTLGGLVLAICIEPLPTPSQMGQVPAAFDAWFARCVARDRQMRFQSIREAAAALEAVSRTAMAGQSVGEPTSDSTFLPATARAGIQASTSGLNGSIQTGPTSVTFSHTINQNKRRLVGIGVIVGLLLMGAGFFIWSKRAVLPSTATNSVASHVVASAVPAQKSLAATNQPVPNSTPPRAVAPISAASAVPVVAVPSPGPGKHSARVEPPKHQPPTAAPSSAATAAPSSAATAAPPSAATAAPPSAATAPVATPRTRANPVDLAF